MIKKTRKNLVLLFTITTSVLITILLCISLFFIRYQITRGESEIFQKNFNEIKQKTCAEQFISLDWIRLSQNPSNEFVYILDNGTPIIPKALRNDTKEKETLIAKIQSKCLEDDINLTTPQYPYITSESSEYKIHYNGKSYQGCGALYSTTNGWISLIFCRSLQPMKTRIQRYVLLLLFLDVICIIFLYLFSKYFVSKTLYPVIESQTKQKEFIAAASHELRSPLAVINSSISLMELSSTKEQMEPIADIKAEVGLMSRLVEDLLFLSTTHSVGWSIKKESIDTESFLIDLYDVYYVLAEEKEITLELSLPDEPLPMMYADKVRIRQVLTILLDNALSYTPPMQSVRLSCFGTKQRIVFSVADTGIGISDEEKKHIFETFYRAQTSRTEKKHFGLGLSIAKEIVELHGGTISVSDTKEGGATFTVELPLA